LDYYKYILIISNYTIKAKKWWSIPNSGNFVTFAKVEVRRTGGFSVENSD